jgi:transposase
LERIFHALQEEQITNKMITILSLDSAPVKAHPDASRALKKRETGVGEISWGLNPKIHMLVADNQCAVRFILSCGEASDAGKGRLLLDTIGRIKDPEEDRPLYLFMDRAYEDRETRWLAFEWGYSSGVPPKKNRKKPRDYNKELYKQRNEVERMYRRLKGFREPLKTHFLILFFY